MWTAQPAAKWHDEMLNHRVAAACWLSTPHTSKNATFDHNHSLLLIYRGSVCSLQPLQLHVIFKHVAADNHDGMFLHKYSASTLLCQAQ